MMADYYEVNSVREDRNGKKRWTRLGVAFPHKQGDGFNITLSAIPAPEDGEFKFVMTRPRERDDRQGGYEGRSESARQPSGRIQSRNDDLDDHVPF